MACAVCLAGFVAEGAGTSEQLMLSPTPFQPDDVGITSVRQAVLVLRAACLLIVLLETARQLHCTSAQPGRASPETSPPVREPLAAASAG